MLRALDPGERRVVLAHERSHLRHRHDRYRTLIRIAARINPLLRPAVRATDLLLERWADEDAARAVGSRRLTARALARAAVAAGPAAPAPGQASFAALPVSARVDALLAATPAGRSRAALVMLTAIALVAALSAALATHDLAHLFDLLRGDG
jgi:beta-lactamase regulating signal transducer with metallopeptidase domain